MIRTLAESQDANFLPGSAKGLQGWLCNAPDRSQQLEKTMVGQLHGGPALPCAPHHRAQMGACGSGELPLPVARSRSSKWCASAICLSVLLQLSLSLDEALFC